MKTILEADFSLTNHQKILLSKIFDAPTSKVAGDYAKEDEYFIKARDILYKLNLIDFNKKTGEINLTDKGLKKMYEEGLIDKNNKLTNVGYNYAKYGSSSPKNQKEVEKAFENFTIFKEIFFRSLKKS